ncbi:MAG TPA: thioredoxin domain-containing protein [Vicinamibacterales bacterium]|nr:thioredoxin domain-containing protein [Vicinamibacterales bacterium]
MSDEDRRSRWQSMIETLAVVVVAASIAWMTVTRASPGTVPPKPPTTRPDPPLPTEPVALADAQLLGDSRAPIGLIIYSDFQCPYCGKFARETLPALRERYVRTGKVRLAFRQFPLPIHASAQKAAEAAECAGRQQRFWPFHDELFARQAALDSADFEDLARSAGLDTRAFTRCLAGETAAVVQTDRAGGSAAGVSGTPTFLAGPILPDGRLKVVRRFSGAQPLAEFERLLDQVIAGVAPQLPQERTPQP